MDIKRVGSGVAVLAVCVFGLGAAQAATASAPASVTAPAAHMAAGPTDVAYLQAARGVVRGTNLGALADADLIGLATSFCEAITNGATAAQFAKSADLMNVPLRTYRSVLALAEITYCPEHIGYRI